MIPLLQRRLRLRPGDCLRSHDKNSHTSSLPLLLTVVGLVLSFFPCPVCASERPDGICRNSIKPEGRKTWVKDVSTETSSVVPNQVMIARLFCFVLNIIAAEL